MAAGREDDGGPAADSGSRTLMLAFTAFTVTVGTVPTAVAGGVGRSAGAFAFAIGLGVGFALVSGVRRRGGPVQGDRVHPIRTLVLIGVVPIGVVAWASFGAGVPVPVTFLGVVGGAWGATIQAVRVEIGTDLGEIRDAWAASLNRESDGTDGASPDRGNSFDPGGNDAARTGTDGSPTEDRSSLALALSGVIGALFLLSSALERGILLREATVAAALGVLLGVAGAAILDLLDLPDRHWLATATFVVLLFGVPMGAFAWATVRAEHLAPSMFVGFAGTIWGVHLDGLRSKHEIGLLTLLDA